MSGTQAPVMGTEKRSQILPSIPVDDDIGFKLPDYDFAANIPTPAQVGVKRGDNLSDVLDAGRGIVYYTDVIGFGQSTNPLTAGLPFSRLGINFFMKTGMQCSNGADMWTYFEGIPNGSALGTRLRDAIKEIYPSIEMRGLAPGILEDTKAALNPKPLLQAALGGVYPMCEQKTMPVGDDKGQIKDPVTGDEWVKGSVQYGPDGRPTQTKWVQALDAKGNPRVMSLSDYTNAAKTHNPDGTPKAVLPAVAPVTEGFSGNNKASLLTAVVLFAIAFGLTCRKR